MSPKASIALYVTHGLESEAGLEINLSGFSKAQPLIQTDSNPAGNKFNLPRIESNYRGCFAPESSVFNFRTDSSRFESLVGRRFEIQTN